MVPGLLLSTARKPQGWNQHCPLAPPQRNNTKKWKCAQQFITNNKVLLVPSFSWKIAHFFFISTLVNKEIQASKYSGSTKMLNVTRWTTLRQDPHKAPLCPQLIPFCNFPYCGGRFPLCSICWTELWFTKTHAGIKIVSLSGATGLRFCFLPKLRRPKTTKSFL